MDGYERVLAAYTHEDIRGSQYWSGMAVSVMLHLGDEGYGDKSDDLGRAVAEMTANAFSSMQQVAKANLQFVMECNRGLLALTGTHVLIDIHNIALALHAERALRLYQKAMTLTPRAALREAGIRVERQADARTPLEDENGVKYNRCGAALYWMRAVCPVLELVESPAPEGCDPQLRLLKTTFGVPRLASA